MARHLSRSRHHAKLQCSSMGADIFERKLGVAPVKARTDAREGSTETMCRRTLGSNLFTLTKFLELANFGCSGLRRKHEAAASMRLGFKVLGFRVYRVKTHSLACSSCRQALNAKRLTTAVQAPAHSGRLLQGVPAYLQHTASGTRNSRE